MSCVVSKPAGKIPTTFRSPMARVNCFSLDPHDMNFACAVVVVNIFGRTLNYSTTGVSGKGNSSTVSTSRGAKPALKGSDSTLLSKVNSLLAFSKD